VDADHISSLTRTQRAGQSVISHSPRVFYMVHNPGITLPMNVPAVPGERGEMLQLTKRVGISAALCGMFFLAAPMAFAQSFMCPNGGYVSRGPCTLCPDGNYVGGGAQCALTPGGRYVPGGSSPPQLAPDGTWHSGGGNVILCPDGTYVTGSRCVLTPSGRYVGG
jgi:hypothetical protein